MPDINDPHFIEREYRRQDFEFRKEAVELAIRARTPYDDLVLVAEQIVNFLRSDFEPRSKAETK